MPTTISFAPLFVPVAVRTTSDIRLGLVFREDVTPIKHPVTNEVRVERQFYGYRIADRTDSELLAYHWHPYGVSPVIHPHMHLSSKVRPIAVEPTGTTIPIAEMHLPTGHIALADIVRLLIQEFGVQPRRSDWTEVLSAAT